MAEEMDKYLHRINIKSKYIHSEVDTLERVEILRQLRLGEIDVLVGVNLLRERDLICRKFPWWPFSMQIKKDFCGMKDR